MTDRSTPDPEDALVALIPGLTRAARALTRSRSDAEDLVQEALLQVWARQRAGARITTLPAYARTTLRNGLRREGRRAQSARSEPLIEGDMASTTAETGPRRVAFGEVMTAIAALPRDQRDALVAVVIDGESPAEVGQRLGVASGTILSRLARARARLRKRLCLPDGAQAASLLPGPDVPTTRVQ